MKIAPEAFVIAGWVLLCNQISRKIAVVGNGDSALPA
tara:strand:- start:3605 stop:3715 length:111 start_codon:yes stop_codon:yes gene_type:complete